MYVDDSSGQRWITASNVYTFAQNHFSWFDTNSLIGIPIENAGETGSSGSHWEKKYILNENMGATSYSSLTYFSRFTMSLMEDSGWYMPDYSYN